jgi:predicted nuclease with TOPRIM domain
VHSLEAQLSAVELNLQALSHQKNEVDEELRQLKGDLMMMTKENQALHHQLQDSDGEKDALSERLRQYAANAQKLEETLAAKVEEMWWFVNTCCPLSQSMAVGCTGG